MVILGLRQEIQETEWVLDEEVNRQVAEIMEATDIEEERPREIPPTSATWKFSMPFAGVRYYSYD